jgi:alkylation response protein AidB-like acyl-CoA dehydrogenase
MLPKFPSDPAEKRQFLLDAVESVRDVVQAEAQESEDIGTLSKDAVNAIYDAGLFALKLPEIFGGAETDPVTQFEVLEAMASVDSSAGWCVMIGATSIGQPAAFAGDEAVAEIFKGGVVPKGATVAMPAGKAKRVDGGYILNGRWPFASGVRHSQWLSTGAFTLEETDVSPTYLMLVYPTSSATILDNWDVTGLAGTGSNDVSVSDLFVPKAFTWDFAAWQPKRGGLSYLMGRPGYVANEHAAFALGVGRHALDEIMRYASEKRRGNPPSLLAHRPAFQRDMAECDFKLRSAHALCVDVNQKGWDVCQTGSVPGLALQSEMRAVAAYATDVVVDVVTRSYRYAGGSALYRPGVLQRCLRDINAAAQHFMVSSSAYENYGAALLDLPDINPMA